MKQSQLSEEVIQLEHAIDHAHTSNLLMQCSREQALWQYAAFCDDILYKESSTTKPGDSQHTACFTDQLINSMKYPIRWIWGRCRSGGHLSRNFTGEYYSAAWDVSKLADEYGAFETVFIYARAGLLALSVSGDELQLTGWGGDLRYEAYDRLLSCDTDYTSPDPRDLQRLIADSVRVRGDRFKYSVNPNVVKYAREILSPIDRHSLRLPPSWQLPQYTFGDFHDVASTLRALAMIHYLARTSASAKGCVGMGIRDSVLIVTEEELLAKVVRYTGLSQNNVSEILKDLRYGCSEIRNPDPALQPLLPIGDDRIAIVPALWLGLNVERNLCVLVNRMRHTKKHYSRLSEDRSTLLRKNMEARLSNVTCRFWHGNIPGGPELPDIDFALIDEREHICLLLELKAFIGPAEPREILDRSKEIEKGISQIKRLRQYQMQHPEQLQQLLDVDPKYQFCFAVCSQNSVGGAAVQDDQVPVVRASHLVRRLRRDGTAATCRWLAARAYLPVEGKHFEKVEIVHSVANRTLTWYAIRPLITDTYF